MSLAIEGRITEKSSLFIRSVREKWKFYVYLYLIAKVKLVTIDIEFNPSLAYTPFHISRILPLSYQADL